MSTSLLVFRIGKCKKFVEGRRLLTAMRLKRSACQRTNLLVFFFTILGLTAGRRLLREPTGILCTDKGTHSSYDKKTKAPATTRCGKSTGRERASHKMVILPSTSTLMPQASALDSPRAAARGLTAGARRKNRYCSRRMRLRHNFFPHNAAQSCAMSTNATPVYHGQIQCLATIHHLLHHL